MKSTQNPMLTPQAAFKYIQIKQNNHPIISYKFEQHTIFNRSAHGVQPSYRLGYSQRQL